MLNKKIGAVLLISIFLSGCATTYHYSTGRKAEREDKESFYKLNKMLESGEVELGEETEDIVRNINNTLNPKGEKSLSELCSKEEGVKYVLKTGEKQESILAKTGEPISKIISLDKKYDEIWEYDFCHMYFKKNRLKKVVFKQGIDGEIKKIIEQQRE